MALLVPCSAARSYIPLADGVVRGDVAHGVVVDTARSPSCVLPTSGDLTIPAHCTAAIDLRT